MRADIEFRTEDGLTLRGWHYVPEKARGRVPTIVMAHGFSGTKELLLDRYAKAFCEAGLAAVVFDHRGFGASEGLPRQHIDPSRQISDYRDAITYAETLPTTDAGRIGIWGSSYSGAHVLVVAANDRRVKCAVSQVPMVYGRENMRRLVRADRIAEMQKMFDEDRRARWQGKPPMVLPVVAPEGEPCALPTPDSYSWMTELGRLHAPSWKNEVTLHSVEMFSEYEPAAHIVNVSPTPLMMVVALRDHLTVADLTLKAYEKALEPKKLVPIDCGHFDVYTHHFARSSGAAAAWFCEHLGPG